MACISTPRMALTTSFMVVRVATVVGRICRRASRQDHPEFRKQHRRKERAGISGFRDLRTSGPRGAVTKFCGCRFEADDLLGDWQRHIVNTFEKGYPLSELSIKSDRDRADDALGLAALAASNDADWAALERLRSLFESLQRWSDDLVEDKRNLRLALYYVSRTALDDDPVFQKNTECGRFIASMLAGKRPAEALVSIIR